MICCSKRERRVFDDRVLTIGDRKHFRDATNFPINKEMIFKLALDQECLENFVVFNVTYRQLSNYRYHTII